MPMQTPKPMNKTTVARNIVMYEKKTKEPDKLSAAFKDRVIDCWDLTRMEASELCALHEKLFKNKFGQTSLVLMNLKKH